MLILKNITKEYTVGDEHIRALRGIEIAFRENEFVSILGPSGCGKTTLLNIIGGLDKYTDGDLSINGRSTRDFSDRDWDTYRNHQIGFVFQNYNLIPHQTVLANVELALTLSGVSKAERRRRAREALEKVGLGDQLNKRPNQMSGGQMQRVAIARALVNDPDILLADEPTGALDTQTSVQVMDILKEVANDRLVIMVTHNPELAERYSTRIVRLLDGRITDDTNPYDGAPEENRPSRTNEKPRHHSMSYLTALSLSLNNLMTKKARTFLTAFAGSIGIIGIALILSLSSGFQNYISRVEEDTLSSYPLTIESESVDMTSLMQTMMGAVQPGGKEHEDGYVYSNNIMSEMMNAMAAEVQSNDVAAFRSYLEDEENGVQALVNDIQYSYDVNLNIYASDTSDGVVQVNPSTIFEKMGGAMSKSPMGSAASGNLEAWQELLDNQTLLASQYEVLAGKWPDAWNEVVLIVDQDNEITDLTLYSLGLRDQSELTGLMQAAGRGETLDTEEMQFSYDELLAMSYRLVLDTQYYEYDEASGAWLDRRGDEDYMKALLDACPEIRITGIIRPTEEAVATAMTGSVGYTHALVEHIIRETNDSAIVRAQQQDPETDVFTGLPFAGGTEEPADPAEFDPSALSEEEQAYLATLSEEERAALLAEYAKPQTSEASYEGNLAALGVADLASPSRISIYPVDFESKEALVDLINRYNREKTDAGQEEAVINYTDYVGLMMSSVSTIINTISYVLIAFVAISLVVSSIMIGIITYISVLERTKEIGILRSIGASKRDISRVFNAETLTVGFVSGMLGILVTVLLCIPVNMLIKALANISNVAQLPWAGGAILVAISMLLTFIAGLIPSRIAARRDPVVALRTE